MLACLLSMAFAAPTLSVHVPPTADGVVELRPYLAADAWTGPPVVRVPVTGERVSLVLPAVDLSTRYAVVVSGDDVRVAGAVLAYEPDTGWTLRNEAGEARPLEDGVVIGE
ncbi:MAG: hypothetical protein ACOZNI_34195 [Myxococcota bacterium]